MKHVSILVLESSVIQAIADPQYLFSTINQFSQLAGGDEQFQIEMVGLTEKVSLNNGLYTVTTTKLLHEIEHTDIIIIPALFGDLKEAIRKNQPFITWIQNQYQNGAELVSLCLGAFLLASTGLMDGKKCSTHWGFQHEFQRMFPTVQFIEGSIITEQQRIYTSGGANSYWNLLLHLVEKYTNRETAILASKYFAIDIDRDSQSAFAMFQGQKSHDDEGIKVAQNFIESNYQEKISIDKLASLTTIGRRSFERRFKKATNNTVAEYIQRIKVEAAKRSFESSRKNISEVMYDVGYSDTNAFRELFKKITGLTPIEYRNKYNKMNKIVAHS